METVIQALTNVISPFTGGRAVLVRALSTLPYKGEKYDVMTEFYRCEDTGEEFASVEQEDATMLQVRALHRKRVFNGTLGQAVAGVAAFTSGVVSAVAGLSSTGSDTGKYGHEQAQSSFNNWRNPTDSRQLAE